MLKIDQALTQAFIDGNFGLPIAHENVPYDPINGQPFFSIAVLPNPTNPIGLEDCDENNGVLHAVINYPKYTGAVAAKSKADEVLTYFRIGRVFNYGGQGVQVLRLNRGNAYIDDIWFKIILDVSYIAILPR